MLVRVPFRVQIDKWPMELVSDIVSVQVIVLEWLGNYTIIASTVCDWGVYFFVVTI